MSPFFQPKLYEKLLIDSGVDVIKGHGKLIDHSTVSVNGIEIKSPRLMIATGGKPANHSIHGLEKCMTSNEILDLEFDTTGSCATLFANIEPYNGEWSPNCETIPGFIAAFRAMLDGDCVNAFDFSTYINAVLDTTDALLAEGYCEDAEDYFFDVGFSAYFGGLLIVYLVFLKIKKVL